MPEISSFDFARIAALKQYSDLEAELCDVMATALKTDREAAAAVFYQITNTRSRYGIIGRLLKQRHRGVYQKAWERIARWLGPCDQTRNHLVHWSASYHLLLKLASEDSLDIAEVHEIWSLRNPAWPYSQTSDSEKHFEKDIWAHRDAMRVMLHIVNRFSLTIEKPSAWPWRETFRQPLTDQSPVELLQRLNDAGLPARLPPYPKEALPAHPTPVRTTIE